MGETDEELVETVRARLPMSPELQEVLDQLPAAERREMLTIYAEMCAEAVAQLAEDQTGTAVPATRVQVRTVALGPDEADGVVELVRPSAPE